jgi:flagellar assembly protein FliH
MTSSKLIPRDTVSSELVTWEVPAVEDEADTAVDVQVELDNLRQQAREAGFAEGHAQGRAAADQQIEAQAKALAQTLAALARPLEELEHRVEDELLALVQAVARQLVRRELRTDPGEVVGVIRAGLNALPVAAGNVVVRLHPEDARLVRDLLKPDADETPWRIQADPVLERGSCQIVTASSQVDGRLETRLGRVIAGLLDDERGADDHDDDGR